MEALKVTNKLYEIAAAQRHYFDRLIEAHGVLTPELEAEGNTICSDMKEKVRDCIAYHAELKNRILGIEREMDRLEHARMDSETDLDRFEAYMLRCLGPDCKVETSLGKLSFTPSQSTELIDEALVPEELKRWVEPVPGKFVPDMKLALKYASEEKPTPGIKINKNYNLRIK